MPTVTQEELTTIISGIDTYISEYEGVITDVELEVFTKLVKKLTKKLERARV